MADPSAPRVNELFGFIPQAIMENRISVNERYQQIKNNTVYHKLRTSGEFDFTFRFFNEELPGNATEDALNDLISNIIEGFDRRIQPYPQSLYLSIE